MSKSTMPKLKLIQKPSSSWIKYDEDVQSILHEKLKPLTFPIPEQEQVFLERMKEYIDVSYNSEFKKYKITPGIAIAANQVGWDKQVIYIHFSFQAIEYKYLLANPKIISYSQSISYLSTGEGCLSVKKPHEGIVPRKYKIIVEAIDLLDENKKIRIVADGLLSINLQHEIDHLNGILYYEHINKQNPFFISPDWIEIK